MRRYNEKQSNLACYSNSNAEPVSAEEAAPAEEEETPAEEEEAPTEEEVAQTCNEISSFIDMVDADIERIPPGEITGDGRKSGKIVFWTIYIDACHGNDISSIARKHVSVWGIENGGLDPLGELEDPLLVKPINCNNPDDLVVGGEIRLHGGCYLEIYDRGLKSQVADLGYDLPEGLKSSDSLISQNTIEQVTEGEKDKCARVQTEDEEGKPREPIDCSQFRVRNEETYYAGENIRLDVNFKAQGTGDHLLFDHPQFYADREHSGDSAKGFEVHSGSVMVQENTTGPGAGRTARWELRADGSLASIEDESTSYTINPDEEPHYLMARQELVLQGEDISILSTSTSPCLPKLPQPYFEFALDDDPNLISIAPECDNSTHLFSIDPVTFHVGNSDNTTTTVRSIVFDPNATCASC